MISEIGDPFAQSFHGGAVFQPRLRRPTIPTELLEVLMLQGLGFRGVEFPICEPNREDDVVPRRETAFPHRRPGYNLLIISEWLDSAQSEACIAWARGTYDAMRPFMAQGRYVNYLGDDESADTVAAAYGTTYERLRKIKKQYDPRNVFRLNQNITPA